VRACVQNKFCAQTTSLKRIEMYANETFRGWVKGFGVRTRFDTAMRFYDENWGPVGENILKSPVLNWNTTSADSATVCLELEYVGDLSRLCVVRPPLADLPPVCK
jgi:hypothetical protein